MKRLFICIAALLLAGCGRWDMDVGAWNLATEACQNHKGVIAADQGFVLGVTARCADGAAILVGHKK